MAKRIAFSLLNNTITLQADEGEVLHELQGQTDRGLGVLGGALLDGVLKRVVSATWLDDKDGDVKECRDRLLEEGAAFTFSVKIRFAFLTGIIGTLVYRDLMAINFMRNKFSHLVDDEDNQRKSILITFATPIIRDKSNALRLPKRFKVEFNDAPLAMTTPRERFLGSVMILYTALTFHPGERLRGRSQHGFATRFSRLRRPILVSFRDQISNETRLDRE